MGHFWLLSMCSYIKLLKINRKLPKLSLPLTLCLYVILLSLWPFISKIKPWVRGRAVKTKTHLTYLWPEMNITLYQTLLLHNKLSKIRHSSQPALPHQPHRGTPARLGGGGKSVGISSSEKKQERVLGALSTNPFSFHFKCALKDHCLPIILSFKLLHFLSRIGHKRHPALFLTIQNSIF